MAARRGRAEPLTGRILLLGALVGAAAGLVEAALLSWIPRDPSLPGTDARYVVWFLAPLVAMSGLAALGALVAGLLASVDRQGRRGGAVLAAILVASAAAYVAAAHGTRHVRGLADALDPAFLAGFLPRVALAGLTAFGITLGAMRLAWGRIASFFDPGIPVPLRRWTLLAAATTAVLLLGTISYPMVQLLRPGRAAAAPAPQPGPRPPNVVLVVLDTVRADHVSYGGYSRPTTPNIDALAARGVWFENAVATSSWSLPSLISVLTGLLPHQHGSSTHAPGSDVVTLPEVLKSWGYATAGFNANLAYGPAPWGLGKGFDHYDDDTTTLRYQLAKTFAGRSAGQLLYRRLVRADRFDRRSAGELNRRVFRWLRTRADAPFFLFIDYFDAHNRYYAPAPFDRRFGEVGDGVIRRVDSIVRQRRPAALPEPERQALITAYDNCLAYLDEQVGRLIGELAATARGSDTYVILTSDHGEAFAEHGYFDHGANLHREAIHVPLIVQGPGVPAGVRVSPATGLTRLFPTVLDLAREGGVPFAAHSLRQHWRESPDAGPDDDEAMSQLLTDLPGEAPRFSLSLTTSRWHYLRDSRGRVELYDWAGDPAEQANLAESAGYGVVLEELERRLRRRIDLSVQPWRRPEYVSVLPDAPFRPDRPPASENGGREPLGVGAAQAYASSLLGRRPGPPSGIQLERLRNLPYH